MLGRELRSVQLFLTNQFFDARDLVQVKYEMVRRVRSDWQPISRGLRLLSSRGPPSIGRTFQQGGLLALMPHKQAHKLTREGWLLCVSCARKTRLGVRRTCLHVSRKDTASPSIPEVSSVRWCAVKKNRGESHFAQCHGPSGSCHPLRAAAPPCAGHFQQRQRGSCCVAASRISSLDPSLLVQHIIASEGSRHAAPYRRCFAC